MPNSALSLRQVACLEQHSGPVRVVRFNKEGQYCASGGEDRKLLLWNPYKALVISSYSGHGYEILDVNISYDSAKLASCGGDKCVIVWDVTSGRYLRKLFSHLTRVNSVTFNEDASLLISGSQDSTAKVWDLRSNSREPIQTLTESKDSVMCVQVDGTDIYTSSVDGCIRRYDVRRGDMTVDHIGHAITSLALSNDRNCLLVSCLDSTSRLMDRNSGSLLAEYTGHHSKVYKCESMLTYDDAYVVGGSEDGNVYAWSLVEADVVAVGKGHTSVVCGIATHPNDHCVLTASVDGTVRMWR